MIQRNRSAETIEDFIKDAVPVQYIAWGREPNPLEREKQIIPSQGPVAQLDITNHPQLNITDLARVYRTDVPGGEGETAYAIDFWMEPENYRVRLIFAYDSPVKVEFSVVFQCSDPTHWGFLRWVAENAGMIALTDADPLSIVRTQTPHTMLLVVTDIAEQLGEFLGFVSIERAEKKKQQRLTGLEMVLAALEAKRFLPFESIAARANVHLGMSIQGTQTVLLKTCQQHQDVLYAHISGPFRLLLQHVARQKNVGVALLDGTLHLVRLDWVAESGYTEETQR